MRRFCMLWLVPCKGDTEGLGWWGRKRCLALRGSRDRDWNPPSRGENAQIEPGRKNRRTQVDWQMCVPGKEMAKEMSQSSHASEISLSHPVITLNQCCEE